MTNNEYFLFLYQTYVKELLLSANHKLHISCYVEDAVQETMLAAWNKIHELQKHECPEKWLYRTLHYKCLHERDRQRQHLAVSLEDVDMLPAYPDYSAEASIEESLPKGLSSAELQLLTWRYQEQRDYIEIAHMLGITEAAATKRVYRAVEHCRKLLQIQHKKSFSD